MPLVSDTTGLRYLIEIEAVHLLPRLFGHVLIPPEVAAELQRLKTPAQVRAWMASPPIWLIIRQPATLPDASLDRLHAGEREAMLLMYEGAAPLFLTDDGTAYKVALRQHIPVIRTLRLLEMAAEHDLIDLPMMLTRLKATTFYAPDDVLIDLQLRDVLRKDAARQAAAQQPPTDPQET